MRKASLSAMMFLQYMVLPVWLLPLLPYVETLDGGRDWTFAFGVLSGVGTLASPFVCMFADRFFNSEKVLAACNLVSCVLLGAAYFTTSLPILFVLLLLSLVAYMPTWSLSSAIVMEHSSPADFPRYRTLGSMGWVASGVFSVIAAKWFDVGDFDLSRRIFAVASALCALGVVVALFLPESHPKAKGESHSVADILGLRAFSLFRDHAFAALAILVFLAMIPFQWYLVYNPVYLADSGFRYLTMTQNLGQVVEIAFLLTIPFLVGRLGYRLTFAAGFFFLAVRYALFYLAAATGCDACIFGGILTHGLIFGLVVVVAQMYVGDFAPPELRNQAQGLIILLTSGLGIFASNVVMHPIVSASLGPDGRHDWSVPFAVAFFVSVFLALAAVLFFRPTPRRS